MHPYNNTTAAQHQNCQLDVLHSMLSAALFATCIVHFASNEGLTALPICPSSVILQLMFVGALVGSGAFGFLCDRWGRRRPLFIATAIVAAAMFSSLAAGTCYWVFVVLRVVTGFGAAGQSHCNFLLSTEPVGPNYRCDADSILGGKGVAHTTAAG
jgi:MFS family permease